MPPSYPATLLLSGRPCLVIGGGRIAERKINSLLHAAAAVRVVTREATPAVADLAVTGAIALRLGEYSDADLDGVFLVIVATNNADLNQRVSAECRRRGLLVNVVDQPHLCNFYVPALLERGPVSLAISTGGASPALAKHLRVVLEAVVGEEYGELSELMAGLRGEMFDRYDEQADRAAAWQRLLDSDVLELLRRGERAQAQERARELLGLPR